jgi:pimeloyl-ACP methyl ester carboxylesterase
VDSVEARRGYADVGGGRLWYEVAGEGPAVILLHSSLVDSRMWDPQMDPFAERFRVCRYDARGWGRSDPPTGRWSQLDDLLGMVEVLETDDVALVGTSMGGRMAIDAALARPEAVSALVPVAATVGGFDRWSDAIRRMWREQEAALERGELDRALGLELSYWIREVDGRSSDRLRELARDNIHVFEIDEELIRWPEPAIGRLGEVRAPTLVVGPQEDEPGILECVDLVASGIPGARRVTIPGSDHHPNLRNPEVFNREVLSFLQEVLR